MKTAALLLLALASVGLAQIPLLETQPVPTLEFDLLVVRMAESTAVPLVEALREPSKAVKAREDIIQMVEKKTARLEGWPIILTQSGLRSVSQQIEEVRYATNYADPTLTKTKVIRDSPKKLDPVQEPTKYTVSVESVSEGVPEAMGSKNTGVTLEAVGDLAPDGSALQVNLHAKHATLVGFRKVEVRVEKEDSKSSIFVEQPQFAENAITTTLDMKDGAVVLLGNYKVPDKEDTSELFIFRARVLK